MAIKFPTMIYVGQDEERGGEKYFILGESPSDLAYPDDVRDVAEYRLIRRVKIVNKTEIKA